MIVDEQAAIGDQVVRAVKNIAGASELYQDISIAPDAGSEC